MSPMLAATTDGVGLTYPLIDSPKLDGIRCLIIDGVATSRSLLPIPNHYVQKLFGRADLNGLDGELIIGPDTGSGVFQRTESGVMSFVGTPDVWFHVFDDFTESGGFLRRLHTAHRRIRKAKCCRPVIHTQVNSEAELLAHEETYLQLGYEGIMLRHPDGPYKAGRSTQNQGWLFKLKRFVDAEAVVIGFMELKSNTNEAVRNKLGNMERSSKKAGMVGGGVLGALLVRDCTTGVEFKIGTGFTATQRIKLWRNRELVQGQLVKYKSQPTGVKNKPRFPVFLGFRDRRDL